MSNSMLNVLYAGSFCAVIISPMKKASDFIKNGHVDIIAAYNEGIKFDDLGMAAFQELFFNVLEVNDFKRWVKTLSKMKKSAIEHDELFDLFSISRENDYHLFACKFFDDVAHRIKLTLEECGVDIQEIKQSILQDERTSERLMLIKQAHRAVLQRQCDEAETAYTNAFNALAIFDTV